MENSPNSQINPLHILQAVFSQFHSMPLDRSEKSETKHLPVKKPEEKRYTFSNVIEDEEE